MKNSFKILIVSIFLSIGLGCIDGVEVELWGECYNIENTFYLNLESSGLSGEIPSEICNQGDSTPSLSNNQLCPPYPFCLYQNNIGYQDTSECPVLGCTDGTACNFDPNATEDDGSCIYPTDMSIYDIQYTATQGDYCYESEYSGSESETY